MARDTELDRLKAAQDLAFQRKQRAYESALTKCKRLRGGIISGLSGQMARELTS